MRAASPIHSPITASCFRPEQTLKAPLRFDKIGTCSCFFCFLSFLELVANPKGALKQQIATETIL